MENKKEIYICHQMNHQMLKMKNKDKIRILNRKIIMLLTHWKMQLNKIMTLTLKIKSKIKYLILNDF